MNDMDAYEILTRRITRMHHTERTMLDQSDRYRAALDAVINDEPEAAAALVTDMRTDAGDAWRARRGVTFWGEEIAA